MVVIKLGGSVITRGGKVPSVATSVLRRLGMEIAGSRRRVVIVHGTGAFGKPPAVRYRYLSGRVRRGSKVPVHRIKAILLKLHAAVVEGLCRAGVRAVGSDSACLMTVQRGRISSLEKTPIMRWLKAGMVPVLSGDMLVDSAGGVSVCSSDDMACALAVELGAEKVIFVTDVDGLCGPIRRMPRDVSGGMAGKMRAALRLAAGGTPSLMINGRKRGRLGEALSGRSVVGSLVRPSKKR